MRELGADDLLVKPFPVKELVAGAHAVSRRSLRMEQVSRRTSVQTRLGAGSRLHPLPT